MTTGFYRVRAKCGFAGPTARTGRVAILAWNRRDTAEAEWRGAMAAAQWMRGKGWCKDAVIEITKAIERGEVLPTAKTKARKRT